MLSVQQSGAIYLASHITVITTADFRWSVYFFPQIHFTFHLEMPYFIERNYCKSNFAYQMFQIFKDECLLTSFMFLLSSSSCCAGSTDIPDPLSPLFPIVHRLSRSSGQHPVSSHSC